jgi:hypothetical protein
MFGKINVIYILHVNEVYATLEDSKNKGSNLLWNPLAKELTGITKLFFSPVGLLHKITFSAISIGEGKLLSDQIELVQLISKGEMLEGRINLVYC